MKLIKSDSWFKKCDILVLTETNIKFINKLEVIDNYDILSFNLCPSDYHSGAGSIIYVKKSVNIKLLDKRFVSRRNEKNHL
jgi:hypothetical protein